MICNFKKFMLIMFLSVFALIIPREGKSQYTIVQADQPAKLDKFAAQELFGYLFRVTGTSCWVKSESALSGKVVGIYVGATKFAATNGINVAQLGEQEWIIRSVGKNIIITGGRPLGTLYGVYEFLENQVGCHWLDPYTEVVPSKPALAFTNLNIRAKPVFWQRHFGIAAHQVNPVDHEKRNICYLRNKVNDADYFGGSTDAFYRVTGSPASCHSFSYYVKASRWFESHPEYFELNDKGQRVPAYDGEGPGQICLTHPDVRLIVLEELRNYIAKDRVTAAENGCPPPRIYDISQNDQDAHCLCKKCQAIVVREGGESGPLVDFINVIAEGIEKDYPDVLIQTFAYNQTQTPPKKLKPRHNVIIRWCDKFGISDLVRPLNHPCNAKHYNQIRAWGNIASHVAVWDYWITYGRYSFPVPYCMIQCIGPDLKLFADAHVEILYCEEEEESLCAPAKNDLGKVECHEPGENFKNLKYWLGYKLAVNPYQPTEPLIKVFMDGYYGAASPKMNEYLNYLQGLIGKEPSTMMVQTAPHKLKYLDLNFFVTAEKIFDSAEALVKPGSLQALHIQKERLIVEAALLYLWPWLERNVPLNAKMPFDHETVIRRYETNLRAQSDAFYSPSARAVREDKLVKLTDLFRNPKLPEKLRNLPPRDVADFNWLTFLFPWTWHTPEGQQRFHYVADEDACGGWAMTFDAENDDVYKKPFVVGVTDNEPVIIKHKDIVQDEKFNFYEIGKFNIKKGDVVWARADKLLRVPVDRLAKKSPNALNKWNVYISLKFKGPAYVKNSSQLNGIFMDRVLLVRRNIAGFPR
ncbi:MAG: DUF4838 domain-containing protein [Verrucomicrobia bacterium]|nr:DUF4838 domain-containing protein [Verrucomicrobiota bacterium]MBU1734777.1 DUF4838 domain-containing protein [Verrucomicrobiota bacterium]MBU1857796.1 DUF4838 domain-containing protein [Verrucomicrobiota bacterium]